MAEARVEDAEMVNKYAMGASPSESKSRAVPWRRRVKRSQGTESLGLHGGKRRRGMLKRSRDSTWSLSAPSVICIDKIRLAQHKDNVGASKCIYQV